MSNRYSLGRTTRLRYSWLLLVAFLFSTNVWAQVSAYSFAQSSGTYTPITGGTVLATAPVGGSQFDSQVWTIASGSFPFSFTFNGTGYTGCYISSNGFITFGTAAPSAFTTTPLSTTIANTGGKIAAWAGDLNTFGDIAARTGEVRWEVVGTAPNREVVIQMANWRPAFASSTTAVYSFDIQYRLGENGSVSVVYGNVGPIIGSPANPSTLTRQIGLGGATTADFNNRTNTSSVLLTASTPGTTNTSTQAYSYVATPPGMPTNGLTYTWAPPAPCVTVTSGGTATASTTTPCYGVSFTVNVTGATTDSPAGFTYQWYSSTDDVTYDPISGATAAQLTTSLTAPAYFRRATICAAGPSELNSTSTGLITPAAAVSVPYSEGFESLATFGAGVVPNCMSTQIVTGTNFTSASTAVRNGIGARTGTDYVWSRWSSNAVLYTPAINLVGGQSYDFAAFYRNTDAIAGFTLTYLVGTSANYLTMTTLGSIVDPVNNTAWAEGKYTYVAPATGVYYFAVQSNSPTSTPWYICWDDFSVVETPSCQNPTALNATAIGENVATLGWTAGGSETIWDLEWGTSGFTQGTGTTVTGLTSNSYALSGLTAATAYQFYVRADCGGTQSPWSGPFTFNTLVPGDNCSNVINLDLLTSPLSSTTVGAAADFSFACNTNASPDLIYSVTVPNGSILTIGQTVNGYDSENYIFYGGGCPGTTQIACYDDPDLTITTWTNNTGSTQTVYYIQDGFSSAANAGTFTLTWDVQSPPPCGITSFPATESFDGLTEFCWTVNNVNGDGDTWNLNGGNPRTGAQSASINTDGNAGANDDYLISDAITLTGNERLNYWYRVNSSFEPNDFEILLSTTDANPASFTNTLMPLTSYSNTTYANNIINLDAYTGTVYIAFRVPSGGLDGWILYLDDITIESIPACPQPTAGVALNVAATSAEVNWTEAGTGTNWDIEYGTDGFVQGTGILVEDIVALPYEISGLTPGTAYDVYYRTDCGGSQSAWSGPISFTTAPGCGSTWTDTGGAGANYSVDEDYVVTICPTVPGEVVSVNFSSFNVENGWDYMLIYNGSTTSDPLIPSGLPAGSNSPANSWTGTTSPGFLTSTAVSGCLTFRFVSDDSFTNPGWVAAVTCAAPPTCGVPSVSGVFPTHVDVSFTINASATGTPVGYEYEIVADGVTPTGTGTSSATNTITAGGLTATTAYDLYVRTDCGLDGFSDWFGPVSFTTANTPPANFNCANAIPISCATPLVSGTTVDALLDPNYLDAGAGGTAPQRGVWYTIVGDDNAYTINTCDAVGFDSRLSVYSGSCGALVPVTGNDDMGAGNCAISGFRSQVTFNANAGTTYYVYVHSFSTFTQAAFNLNVSCAPLCPAPANDACASAQVLTQASTCTPVSGTTVCATNTPGLDNPAFGGSIFSTINDVWYTFTATAEDGYFLFDNVTAEGLYYTIYFEDPCGGSELGESGAQGDVIPGEQLLFIGAVIGDQYWLRVNVDPTVQGAADGTFDLCAVSLPCSTPVTVDAVATSATNIEVTHSGVDGDAYIIEYGPVGFTPGTDGTAGAGGTIVATTTLVTNVTVASGTYDFYVRKDCSGAAEGYSLNQFGGTVATPPANDNCADAIAVTCGSTTAGTTAGATISTGETAAGVWYSFLGDGSQVTASTCGTSVDTYIQIYTGACGGPYTSIAFNDDFCAPGSQVTFSTFVGITYYILVRNFGTFTTGGAFNLNITCVAPPANDNCATAQAITCGSVVNGTTVAATTSTGETTAGVWYSIVGDGSTISASTCGGATWNTFLQVYTGPCGGPYTSIASNDNACGNQSTVSWLSTVGETYYVLVRGVGTANGTFTLTTTCQNICTTIQNPGSVLGPNTICAGVSFTLNATNVNVGTVYQWQRRTAGTNWANIAGATSSSLTTSQTVATEYRVRIGCNNSGLNSISSVLAVAMTPFLDCFCTPTTGDNTGGDFIAALNFGSISNNSGVNPSVYTSYTAAQHTTTILRGGQHSGTFTVGTFGTNNVGIWIDFNRDGTFQSTERVYNNTTNLAGNSTTPFTVNVPVNASLGTTKMRIRKNDVTAGGPAIDPCAAYSWTETEDYVITIANGSVNDSRANATVVNPANFPSCSNLSGNLANATPSATGEGNDLWYSFTAESNGVRIQLTGSGDNLIELEDEAGNTIETQNTAGGSEILANGSLTPGAVYYVAVRNVTGPASFTVCIQTLAQSTCDNGPVFTSLCNVFKADWTGTANYVATFTETAAPFNVYVGNLNGTTSLPLRNVAGLAHGRSYNVRVDAVYTIGSETITVEGDGLCTITITQHPFTNLRTIDADPNTRTIGAFIGTDVLICGNTDYEWSFELVDASNNPIGIEGPVSVLTGSNSRYIRTSQIPGVSAGNRYRVRVRPIFGAEPGVFDDGTFRYLQIAGSAGMVDAFDGEVAPEAILFERNTENGVFAALYPNPNNGDMVNLNIAGLDSESVQVRIFDATGRVVFSNRYVVEGALNTIVSFDNPLTSGMYIVEMTFGKEVITERMMVSK